VTAPVRRDAARSTIAATSVDRLLARWRLAEPIRREWLDHGLDTAPADRPTTQGILSRIYARHGRPRPRFHWVDSPHQALPLLTGLPTHDDLQRWVIGRPPPGAPPLISDIAAGLSRLRSALDEGIVHPDLTPSPVSSRKNARRPDGIGQRWPVLAPADAIAAGVPLRVLLRQGVRDALWTSLAVGFYLPVRAALAGPVPSAWYGQQDAHWVAYYDVLRRLGLAQYRRSDETQFDDWATLARSTGWWWPGERVCVLVERPAVIRTEPAPGGLHGEQRPARDVEPPVVYRDGWRPAVHRDGWRPAVRRDGQRPTGSTRNTG
jgi:hypothetical protein